MSDKTRAPERQRIAEIRKAFNDSSPEEPHLYGLLEELLDISDALAYDLSNVIDQYEKLIKNKI